MINCFIKKIFRKTAKYILCFLEIIRFYPNIDQYNHKVIGEEAICYDINKVLMKIERNLNAKRK